MVTFQRASGPVSSASTLLCLLLASSLQIALVSCQDGQSLLNPKDDPCDPECGPGYECIYGICKRQDCTRIDCSGVADKLVCGSIGDTYNNLCELERAKCEFAYKITVVYPGSCVTAAPPPAQDCKAHQISFDNNYDDHIENCSLIFEENSNGTLDITQSKLDNCYRPHCDPNSDKYLIKQCLFEYSEWCWCSTVDGQFIKGTLQENMPEDYCSNQRTCVVDGRTHNDGAVFTTPRICGLCKCSNGTHTPIVELDVDASGRLSNDSLDRLKRDLIQVFNFQYNHKDPNIANIELVYQHPTKVSEDRKNTILDWKFNHFDTDQDNYLNNIEKTHNFLKQQLVAIFGCGRFLDYVSELVDENGDHKITLKEWKDFFHTPGTNESGEGSGELSQPVKREAVSGVSRKSIHLRKKFYYTLQ